MTTAIPTPPGRNESGSAAPGSVRCGSKSGSSVANTVGTDPKTGPDRIALEHSVQPPGQFVKVNGHHGIEAPLVNVGLEMVVLPASSPTEWWAV
ncbi:MAG: hypothetical protein E6G60_19930 [Actinobacteria bacterium]|nr:MAG: hypothetical protein E6G60_19930 [Actinomycetota bacterium]